MDYRIKYNKMNSYIARKHRQKILNKATKMFLTGLSLVVILLPLIIASVSSLDEQMDTRDKMLCHSARVSGNKEMLNRCKCYYEGGDIRCLQW